MERLLTHYVLEKQENVSHIKPALIFFAAVLFVLTLIAIGVPLLLILVINALLCAGYIAFTSIDLSFSLDIDLDGDEVKEAIEKDLFGQ